MARPCFLGFGCFYPPPPSAVIANGTCPSVQPFLYDCELPETLPNLNMNVTYPKPFEIRYSKHTPPGPIYCFCLRFGLSQPFLLLGVSTSPSLVGGLSIPAVLQALSTNIFFRVWFSQPFLARSSCSSDPGPSLLRLRRAAALTALPGCASARG